MSIRIGTNIRRDGSDNVGLIVVSGAQFVRFVPMLEEDLTDYLRHLVASDVEPLGVLAKESFGLHQAVDWDSALAEYAQRYGRLVRRWQIGNEFDVESDSSWTMELADLSDLGRRARKAFGKDAYLIVGGAADGSPSDEPSERLSGADLSWANAIAIHTYGQGVPGWTRDDGVPVLPISPYGFPSTIRDLIDGYKAEAPDKDLWITEMGFRWDELGEAPAAKYCDAFLAYLTTCCPEVVGFGQFCLTDDQVHGFGLYHDNGHQHQTAPVFTRYAEAARDAADDDDEQPAGPMTAEQAEDAAWSDLFLAASAVDRPAVYGLDLGIVKFWRENHRDLGSAVGPERHAATGEVFQAFACAIVKWTPADGASKVA